MNVLSISASISVTITDIWTKFGTDLKFHSAYTPEWSNSQPHNTRCRLQPFWIFRLYEIKNVSSSGLDEDICITFYGIMHWTLAYNSTHSLMTKDLTGHTGPNGHLHMPIIKLEKKINKTNMQNSACTVNHVVQAVLTVWTIVSCSNNFNTKLGR